MKNGGVLEIAEFVPCEAIRTAEMVCLSGVLLQVIAAQLQHFRRMLAYGLSDSFVGVDFPCNPDWGMIVVRTGRIDYGCGEWVGCVVTECFEFVGVVAQRLQIICEFI